MTMTRISRLCIIATDLFIRYACRNYAIFLLIATLLWIIPPPTAAEQNLKFPKSFRCGFLQSTFQETDPRDAKAAMEVHIREILRNSGLKMPTLLVMFTNMTNLTDALRNGELELVTIPTIDYLRIRDTIPLIPAFVRSDNNGTGNRYVIIARKDSGIRSLSDLKGKSIMIPPIGIYEPAYIWLDNLLIKSGKKERNHFFGPIKEVRKASSSIMGVFFRQSDAAVVTRAGFDINRQLNPPLETQLTVLAESPSLINEVVCFIPDTSEQFRSVVYNSMLRLNEYNGARQIFTMLQITGMTPFKPANFENVVNLFNEHKRQKAKRP